MLLNLLARMLPKSGMRASAFPPRHWHDDGVRTPSANAEKSPDNDEGYLYLLTIRPRFRPPFVPP